MFVLQLHYSSCSLKQELQAAVDEVQVSVLNAEVRGVHQNSNMRISTIGVCLEERIAWDLSLGDLWCVAQNLMDRRAAFAGIVTAIAKCNFFRRPAAAVHCNQQMWHC